MSAKSEFHIPSLDGIRGLAALTVFLSHAALPNLIPGGFGVTVFFFLSGYLITTLLRREYEGSGRIALKNFYLRRVYRILPPMYIVLVLAILLGWLNVFPNQMTPAGVFAQFAHFTNYYMIYFGQRDFAPATSIMWSLAVEEHFYLLFPLLLGLLYKRLNSTRVAGILFAVCATVLLWRLYLVFVAGCGHNYVYPATDTRLDSILYGCILGVWCNPVMDRNEQLPGRNAWIVLLAASVGLLLLSFLYRMEEFRETFRYSIQGIGLFSIFFCAVRFHRWPMFSWLEARPMRALGLISYTFYLVHIPCLLWLKLYFDLNTWQRTILGFIATVTVSAIMYWVVERHMGALRKRLHGRKDKEASQEKKLAPAFGQADRL